MPKESYSNRRGRIPFLFSSYPISVSGIVFLPLSVSTSIPPRSMAIPAQEVPSSRSPTITTLSNAAVSGSASDNVTAEDDGIRFKPVENRMYATLVVAMPRYNTTATPRPDNNPSVSNRKRKGSSIIALIEKMTATAGTAGT